MIEPEAIFDVLYIGEKVERKIGDFALPEIYFFSYLGCLLSIYDGKNTEDWHFNFIVGSSGALYSISLEKAYKDLASKQLIFETSKGYYSLTILGKKLLHAYSNLKNLQSRINYLDNACACLSLIPYGILKSALENEPVIFSSKKSNSRKLLLEGDTLATRYLYEQFKTLHEALGEQATLLVPAITWIQSLQNYTNNGQ